MTVCEPCSDSGVTATSQNKPAQKHRKWCIHFTQGLMVQWKLVDSEWVIRGVFTGVEKTWHCWAEEGVETGETNVVAWRHVHAPTEPDYAHTV